MWFSNLGTFDQTLEVRIYVDHEDNASSLYGNVQISLQTIKQNQPVEEWFPILPFEANETDENGSLGRMSLNIQVREIIVSESEEYTALEEVKKQSDTENRTEANPLATVGIVC